MTAVPFFDRHEPPAPGTVVAWDAGLAGAPRWLAFTGPSRIIQAHALGEVPAALRQIESAVREGYYAAGFLTYEAAPAFDAALVTQPAGALPLLWFGLYERAWEAPPPAAEDDFAVSPWTPSIPRERYEAAIRRIKDYIAAGDTYQVNFTFRLRAEFSGCPWAFFAALCRAQRGGFPAYVDTGAHVFCSASPELFFTRQGEVVTCRPMKGTAPRGLTCREDEAHAAALRASAKERAENVMITDMIRNDLGRIAETGSVRVDRLFDAERYDTLWQMTSTVTARTDAPFSELLTALFPCASITGAPKVRTSQLIAALEDSPRGIYTGNIGFLTPAGDAQFNVAIRTAHLQRRSGQMEYGTGSGIVWDSRADNEYAECRTKALVLTERRPAFQLLETLLWKPASGFFLLDRHLQRLADSARYFGIPLDVDAVTAALHAATAASPTLRRRVRLLVNEEGRPTVESFPLPAAPLQRRRVTLATQPVDAGDRFLYHKTTRREVYEAARRAHPGVDDVLLVNTRGEVTEATIANLVIRRGGRLLTPPVGCGLLPGVYRAHLLASGRIKEAVITAETLRDADAIYLINSVRGWMPATLA